MELAVAAGMRWSVESCFEAAKQQTGLDLVSLERVIGRSLSEAERAQFTQVQHQAMRWTFLGSALSNKGFLEALGSVSEPARARIEQVAPAFC